MDMMDAVAKNAERESKGLRGQLEAAEQRARRDASLLGGKVEAAGREAELAAQASR